jgi:uncharacterized protein
LIPRSISIAAAIAWLCLGGRTPCAQAETPPQPPERWVTDKSGFLSPATRQALDGQLEAYERTTGRQVLIYIDRTTGGVPIEDFAVKAFAAWRVGRKGIDDGLVLFLFTEDRRLRFEVGYGLEDKLPDALAARIVRETIVPRIQEGRSDEAITEGVRLALATIEGQSARPATGIERPAEGQPSAGRAPPSRAPLSIGQKVFFALLAIGFLILLMTNPSLAIYLLFSILSGGRGGGSGGGGGFSGGGGRSGGGGASGSW